MMVGCAKQQHTSSPESTTCAGATHGIESVCVEALRLGAWSFLASRQVLLASAP